MQEDSNKNLILIAGGVVVLIFLGWFFLFSGQISKPPETAKTPELPVITPIITQAPAGQQTAGLPQDFPLNGKTKIIESYSATYPNSTAQQTTVVFESSKTMKQNYDFYLKWAGDNEWEILNQTDEETLKSIYIKRGGEDINITTANELITISYVKF